MSAMTGPIGGTAPGAAGPSALPPYLLLYAALYGAYGSISPFLPNVLAGGGLSAQEIGVALAAATTVRLIAAPLAGRFADRSGATRPLLAGAAGLAGAAALLHLAGQGFWPLLAIGLAYAVATAPLGSFADTLALAASATGRGFTYGWVRGAGSAAFILATSAVGWFVRDHGLSFALMAAGALFGAAALVALMVPAGTLRPGGDSGEGLWQGFRTVFAISGFPRVVLVGGLVVGAHAMHDAFAMILWEGAGITPDVAGLLWSVSVAAEVVVFFLVGPLLLRRLGPAGAIALAAGAGTLRWGVMASTAALPALIGTQLLHGLTFALLHLACLRLIAQIVPARLGATALTLFGAFGQGLASALLMLASGTLYARFGAGGFWVMAAISLLAVPIGLSLRSGKARPVA
jgi:PPP family 3-phenylpropionic acid transporter